MPLETKEIPSLLGWVLILGIAIYATSRLISKVHDKITDVFVLK